MPREGRPLRASQLTHGRGEPHLGASAEERSGSRSRATGSAPTREPCSNSSSPSMLIALNGLFSLSELAVVSARRIRLRDLGRAGPRRRRGGPAPAEDPGRFLSTVQIGITLVGILAGAFSGAALGERLGGVLEARACAEAAPSRSATASSSRRSPTSRSSIGELVPKHLALTNPEAIACAVAPLMALVSRVGRAGRRPARLLDPAPVPAVRRLARERDPGHGRGGQDHRRRGRGGRAPSRPTSAT